MPDEQANEYVTWDLQWTPEHVQRFWDWMAGSPHRREGQYFSRQVGSALLDYVQKHISLTGTVIDWGAGAGFLVEQLLQRGSDTIAVDISKESIATLQDRLGAHPRLRGAVSISDLGCISSTKADTIFLIETLEHLDDEALEETISSLSSFLSAGGHLVVTTPNDEDLEESKLACPNCGCVFHRVQHVRSFNRRTLQEMLAMHGFRTVSCREMRLSAWPKPIRRFDQLRYTLRGRTLPHLVFIGQFLGI